MKKNLSFTDGKLFAPMVQFAIPVMLSYFLQTMYGAVDMIVVGRFASASDVSAISTGSWVMSLITCLVTGVSVGTTVLLGQRLGAGRPQEAGRIIGVSVVLFTAMCLVIILPLEIFAPQLADCMLIPPEARTAAIRYIRICGAGSIFIVGFNVIGSVFRGIGNSVVPLIAVAIACAANIAADVLLVAVFHMAASGAAVATVFSQMLSVVLSLCIIARQDLGFKVKREDFCRDKIIIKNILKIGIPSAFQNVIIILSFIVVTSVVNSLGVVMSAAVGIGDKICGFVVLIPSAFGQTVTSVVAQNTGANKPERAKRALVYGIAASLSMALISSYITFFHGTLLASFFSRDQSAVAAAAQYLKAYAADTVIGSFMFGLTGYFIGLGKTTFTMLQSIISAFCVRIPIAYIMSRQTPVNLFHVGLATPASSLAQVLMCGAYLWLLCRQEKTSALV